MAVYKMDVSERKAKLLQIISPAIPEESHFGYSVDMDDDLLVVGAYNFDGAGSQASGKGQVWVYKRESTDQYSLLATLAERIGGLSKLIRALSFGFE